MRVCVDAGGALSGEHGIGIEKKEFMGMIFTDTDLDVMGDVKSVFNPTGMLNPSKIFPSSHSCSEVGRSTTTSTVEIGKRVEAMLLGGSRVGH
jgi:glycolate oxidase